jgi:UDP-N-acetylglucosamine 4,6-dehydratase
MHGVDVVIHAAALKRIEVGHYNPIEMVKTNVDGAINVIEAAQDTTVQKVVGISSDKAYQPVSPYGQTKAIAESLFLTANNTSGWNGPRFAICRYGNVWGSTGSVVPVWLKMLADDPKAILPVTDPECTRFFMRMSEAVDLVLDTVRMMKGGEISIPVLPAYRLGDLVEAIGGASGEVRDCKTLGLPKWEKLHESMDDMNCSKDARRMSIKELEEELCRK